LLAGEQGAVDSLKQALFARFPMKNLGKPQIFCGINIQRAGTHAVGIHQAPYVEALLLRFGFADCQPVPIPTATARLECVQPSSPSERAQMLDVPYREAVGCLLWLSTNTRPDIAFAVHQVARCVADPRPCHWTAVKRIYRYLRGTTCLGLLYDSTAAAPAIKTFSDSDWAGDSTRRTTTSCFIVVFGTPLKWRVRLLKSVALSSMEAELMALSEAGKEGVFLLRLLTAVGGIGKSSPFTIAMDNDSARQALARSNPTPASRHIEVRHFWVREKIKERVFDVVRVSSADNIADWGTKPVTKEIFLRFTKTAMHHFNV